MQTPTKTKTVYELILVDPVWDNWEHMGWVTDLKDAAPKFKNAVVEAITQALEDGAKIVKKPFVEDEIEEVVYTRRGKKRGDPPIIDEIVFTPKKKKREKFLTADEVEKAIKMPDDFIQEYPSTFSMCIDRPYVTIEELVDECLPGWELAEPFDGESTLCIRGFIHEWPENVVRNLMAWEDTLDVFENLGPDFEEPAK